MALTPEYHRLLYQIAQAYYVDDLTQAQIAKNFGISRPKVSRLLKRAREIKIVNITFIPPSGTMNQLERDLRIKYNLEEVIAVPVSNSKDPAMVARELGRAASDVLVRRITGTEIVGIAWGTTLMALVDALPYKSIPLPDVTIVQMVGGLGPVENLEHSSELARRMAQKFNAKYRLLSAPGVVPDRQTVRTIKSIKQISDTLDMVAKADMAVVSMGNLSSESFLMRDGTILTKDDYNILKKSNAVGDIALHFIDKDGILLDMEINERIIGLTNEQLKKIPMVVAVAGGEEKYQIIRAGLLSGIPRIFITDHITAEKLIDEK